MPVAQTVHLGLVDYGETVALQKALHARFLANRELPDTWLTLEHTPIVTCGHRTQEHETALLRSVGFPVVDTERGGQATYHGPGQLVAYPIFDLNRHGSDIKQFVRKLEAAIIDTLGIFEVDAVRRGGYPGVWTTDGQKIASVGIRVRDWVSFHGIAINVNCDLDPFTWFTPCGIPDVSMTSIAQETARDITIQHVADQLNAQMAAVFGVELDTRDQQWLRTVPAIAEVPTQQSRDASSTYLAHTARRIVELVGAPPRMQAVATMEHA